jgi:hypothetical protein
LSSASSLGHNGSNAADLVKKYLPQCIVARYTSECKDDAVLVALRQGMEDCAIEVETYLEKNRDMSGTTASIVLIDRRFVLLESIELY